MWRCKECDWPSTEHLAVCQNCGAWGSLVSDTAAGPRNAVLPRVRGALVSTKDLARMDRPSLPLSAAWKNLFGSLPSCFGLMVYGPPGSGKSHWLMLLAAELARFAPVLYVASESGQSNATIQMVQRLEVYSDRILVSSAISAGEIVADLCACNARFIVLDSLTCVPDLSLVALSQLAEKERLGVAFSLHVTKTGTFRGQSHWAHWTDVVARIEDHVLTVEKNRFGPVKAQQLDYAGEPEGVVT
ncbi:MAG: AAA family ATPase [Planctomycetota bacterium]